MGINIEGNYKQVISLKACDKGWFIIWTLCWTLSIIRGVFDVRSILEMGSICIKCKGRKAPTQLERTSLNHWTSNKDNYKLWEVFVYKAGRFVLTIKLSIQDTMATVKHTQSLIYFHSYCFSPQDFINIRRVCKFCF